MPSSTRRPAPRAGTSRASIRGVPSLRGRDRAALASRKMSLVATDKVTLRGGSALEVLRVFLRLGLTSFGGPIAHLGYFRTEFVEHRKWLDEKAYADLVALSQFLPGPASSKVGIAIGLLRAGYAGAFAAWIGFTLPSALALVLFAYGVSEQHQ